MVAVERKKEIKEVVRDYLEELKEKYTPSTVKTYRRYLNKFIRWATERGVDPLELSTNDVEDIVAFVAGDFGLPSNKRHILRSVLDSFYTYLERGEVVRKERKSPLESAPKRKKERKAKTETGVVTDVYATVPERIAKAKLREVIEEEKKKQEGEKVSVFNIEQFVKVILKPIEGDKPEPLYAEGVKELDDEFVEIRVVEKETGMRSFSDKILIYDLIVRKSDILRIIKPGSEEPAK